jgi:hypothetical protein
VHPHLLPVELARARSSRSISAIGIVVPARDEQALLGHCPRSIDLASRVADCDVHVVVVLDDCLDATAEVASVAARTLGVGIELLTISARTVGTARRLGTVRLLERHAADDDMVVATTDADSVVPADWLVRQRAHVAAGASLVVGTVRVDEWHDRPHLRRPWQTAYDTAAAASGRHRHVHGANLAFLAAAYGRTAGFADVAHDEDVGLVRAFEAAGEPVVWAADLPVVTSSRSSGRAPHGFAAALDRLAATAEPATPRLEMT